MIRRWFRFVKEHHAEMFQEWKSTGRYIVLFEFFTREGHHAYKERRKDWSGPYAEYKKVDPYELFDKECATDEYW